MILREPGCCDGWWSVSSDVNGTCPDCGIETIDGESAYGCVWSPISCKTCGHKACDGSC